MIVTNSIIVNRILPIHWCSISISYYASLFFPFSVFLLLLLFSLTIKPNFSCFFPNVGSICADLRMHRKILWLSNLTLAAFSPCGLHRCRPPYAWEKNVWGTSSSSFIFYRVWKLWCSFYSVCKGLSFFNICVRLFTQKIKNFTLNYKIY